MYHHRDILTAGGILHSHKRTRFERYAGLIMGCGVLGLGVLLVMLYNQNPDNLPFFVGVAALFWLAFTPHYTAVYVGSDALAVQGLRRVRVIPWGDMQAVHINTYLDRQNYRHYHVRIRYGHRHKITYRATTVQDSTIQVMHLLFKQLSRYHLTPALAALEAGEPQAFGTITLTQDGIQHLDGHYRWQDIQAFQLQDEESVCAFVHERWITLAHLRDVENWPILEAICQRMVLAD